MVVLYNNSQCLYVQYAVCLMTSNASRFVRLKPVNLIITKMEMTSTLLTYFILNHNKLK